MFCNKCGNKLLEDEQFCTVCGNKIFNTAINSIIETKKELTKSLKKSMLYIFLIITLFVIILVFLIFLLYSLNVDRRLCGIFTILLLMALVFGMLRIMKKKNNNAMHYNILINSNFDNDSLLEQKLIEKLNSMQFVKTNNNENIMVKDAIGRKKNVNKSSTFQYLKYNVSNGKIYLEAWLKINGQEFAIDTNFYGAFFKYNFLDELQDISNYFEF